MTDSLTPQVATKMLAAINSRRAELLKKEVGPKLSEREYLELQLLHSLAEVYVAALSPPVSKQKARAMIRKLNPRRGELIHKKHSGGGLTVEENEELAELDLEVGRYVDVVAPIDTTKMRELEEILGRNGLS